MIGLATSQIATDVLTGEGLQAANVTRWLAAQDRLAAGHGIPDDEAWRMRAGDLVVVDESAMTATADLAAIRARTQAAEVKLLLTGDHRQLAAVGAGGGMALIAEQAITHELAEVRRFTAPWERAASLRLREGDPGVLTDYRTHGRVIDAGTVEQAEAAAARAWLADHLAGRHSLLITDTNEQANRISAALRAELVRLGRVSEDGVPLPRQGTSAGIGDIVTARRNGWHLTGHEGNRRGPVNRERYQVTETRPDGSLVVVPERDVARGTGSADSADSAATRATRRAGGERIVLPAYYVAAHVTLGYASTVHSAQGLTVDTCHTVATTRTGPAALYVGLTRGRHTNTAYVTTIAVPDDAPSGAAATAERRDPLTVLIGAMQTRPPEPTAIATAEQSAADAASIATLGERFADVADQATAGRTAALLDHLTTDGKLTVRQRHELAADSNLPTLARVLRRAEVAGHYPAQILDVAVSSRPLDGARSLAGVLHQRILDTTSLEPVGDRYADWIPTITDPTWRAHLHELASAADQRRAQLGAEVREQQPRWARETLGPVPEDPDRRRDWEHRAGIVAAHRELTRHDDTATGIGGPPKPGQVEAYASWRAAWRALGRPDADRAEAEISEGQLRVRVRAYEREQNWEPDYVAHQLSAVTQAEARARQSAQLVAARAEVAPAGDRIRLQEQAAAGQAEIDRLSAQREQLTEADEIRARWYAHTAQTRATAERARVELSLRGIDPDHPENPNTAAEWLAAQAAADREYDRHRVPTHESDLAHIAAARSADLPVLDPVEIHLAEPAPRDIRQVAVAAPTPTEPATRDWTRIPSVEETSAALARARRALFELDERAAAETRRDVDELILLPHCRPDARRAAEHSRPAAHETAIGLG